MKLLKELAFGFIVVAGLVFGLFMAFLHFDKYQPYGSQCDHQANYKLDKFEKIINP